MNPLTRPEQICTNCVMDTTDSAIQFDENGVPYEYDPTLEPDFGGQDPTMAGYGYEGANPEMKNI